MPNGLWFSDMRAAPALVFTLLLVLAVFPPMAQAAPVPGTATCTTDTATNPRPASWYSLGKPGTYYSDNCFHQHMTNAPDTANIDIVIAVPVGPLPLRDISLLRQSIAMWEDGLKDGAHATGRSWLADGLEIQAFVAGVDVGVPGYDAAIQDPEIIIITTDVVAAGYAGAGSDTADFCHGLPTPLPSGAQVAKMVGFDGHHNNGGGTMSVECGDGGGGRVCVVTNNAWLFTPSTEVAHAFYDLNSHELGHCLGVGHVGDSHFAAKAYPPDDIMSYASDTWSPPYALCVSNLDIKTFAWRYQPLIPGAPARESGTHGPDNNKFMTMEGGRDPWANPSYPGYSTPWRVVTPAGTLSANPADCYQPDTNLLPLPTDEPEPEPEPGQATLAITTPTEGAELESGTFVVEGTAARIIGTTGPGTSLGTDVAGDTGGTCPAQTPPCNLANVNAARPGLDLRQAWVKKEGANIVFTFQVENASRFFVDPTGDPAVGAPTGGHIVQYRLSVGFLGPTGANAPYGMAHDVSVNRATGAATLTASYDRKVLTPVGSLSGGALSQGTTAGTATVDLANNRFTVSFPTSNADHMEPLTKINATSIYVIQGTSVNSIVTTDFINQQETTTWSSAASGGSPVPQQSSSAPASVPWLAQPVHAVLGWLGLPSPWGHASASVAPAPQPLPAPSIAAAATPAAAPTTAPATTIIQDGTGDVTDGVGLAWDLVTIFTGDEGGPPASAHVPHDAMDIEKAWFETDDDFLYIGLKVKDIPADPATTAQVLYAVNFKPNWTSDWDQPAGNTFNGLRATALLSMVGLGDTLGPNIVKVNPGFTTDFELQHLSTTPSPAQSQFGTYTTIPLSTLSTDSDIIWFVVPRTVLNGVEGGDFLAELSASTVIGASGIVTFGDFSGDSAQAATGATFAFPSSNAAPVAAFTCTPTGLSVACSAAASSDADGAIEAYAWTFGDASSDAGVSVNHAYATAGEYDVTLTVTDDLGATGTLTKEVTVSGGGGGDACTQASGERVELRSASTCLGVDAVAPASPGNEPWSVAVTGLAEGPHTLSAKWIAANGAVLATDSVQVTVDLPVAGTLAITSHADGAQVTAGSSHFSGTATPTAETEPVGADITEPSKSGTTGTGIAFTSSVTGGESPYTCTWSATTGTPTITGHSCAGATFNFAAAGDYTINLTAEDDAGANAYDEAIAHVTASGTPLSVSLADAVGTTGQAVTVTATPSGGAGGNTCAWETTAKPAASTATFSSGTACTRTFTGSADGEYTIQVVVTDSASATAQDTATVTLSTPVGPALTITSPTDGATDVASPVDILGTVTNLDSLDQQSAHGWFNYGDFDPVARQQAGILWEPWMESLRPTLESMAGFQTGLPMVKDGHKTLQLLFTTAPSANLEALVPDDWRLDIVVGAKPIQLKQAMAQDVAQAIRESAAVNSPNGALWNDYIGPGSQFAITFEGEEYGGWLCTANWVWKDQSGKLYLGAAGHCFLPADKTATHGAGADFTVDPALLKVYVCRSTCLLGGYAGNIDQGDFVGDWVQLGKVAYARQTAGVQDVGNDFGIVEIPPALYGDVSPEMPVWGGPTQAAGSTAEGQLFFMHGNAAEYGETFATKSRTGVYMDQLVLGSNGDGIWNAITPSYGGDSGSAVGSLGPAQLPNLANGVRAAGILTHGYGVEDCTAAGIVGAPCVGVGASLNWAEGTTTTKAVTMARQAGLCIRAVLAGEDPVTAANTPECGVDTGPVLGIQYAVDAGAFAAADSFTEAAGTWSVDDLALAPGAHTVQVRLVSDGTPVAGVVDSVTFTVPEATGGGQACTVDDEFDALFGADLPGNYEIVNVCAEDADVGLVVVIEVYDMLIDQALDGIETTVGYNVFIDGIEPIEVTQVFLESGPFIYDWATAGREVGATAVYDYAADTLTLTLPVVTNAQTVQVKTLIAEGFMGGYGQHIGFGNPAGIGVPAADAAPDDGPMELSSASIGGLPTPSRFAASGPHEGSSGERVELWLDGAFVGSDAIATGSGADTWSIAATLSGAGSKLVSAEWYAASGELVDAEEITVTVEEVPNAVPTVAVAGITADERTAVVVEAQQLSRAISGFDPDSGDILTFVLATDAPGATLVENAAGRWFNWTPDNNDAGTYYANVSVSDGNGGSDFENFTVVVTNPAPTLQRSGPSSVTRNSQLSLSFVVSDLDADPAIQVSHLTNATGGQFELESPTKAWFNWTPADEGVFFLNVTANDGQSMAYDNGTITVTSNGNNGNQGNGNNGNGNGNGGNNGNGKNGNAGIRGSAADPSGGPPSEQTALWRWFRIWP